MSLDARAKDHLRSAVDRAARELEDAAAADIVAWADAAVRDVGGRLVVASSMQDAVLPHVVSSVVPEVEVLFLDTGLHFAATLATRERVARQLPVRVVDVRPRQTVQEQAREFGPALHERDPGLCCFLRKVEPLARARAVRRVVHRRAPRGRADAFGRGRRRVGRRARPAQGQPAGSVDGRAGAGLRA